MARSYEQQFSVKDKGSKDVKKATDKINKNLDKVEKKSKSVTSSLTANWKKVAGAFAAVSIATVLVGKTFKDVLTYGDELGKLHTRLGADVKELDKLRQAADLAGVSFSLVTKGMEKLVHGTHQVAEGARSEIGPVNLSLKELGLNAKELDKLDPTKQIISIANALKGIESASARISIVKALGLNPAFLQMVGDLDEKMKSLNSRWSNKRAKDVENFNDRWAEFKNELSEIAVVIVTFLLPYMETYIVKMRDWIKASGDFIEQKIPEFIDSCTKAFEGLEIVLRPVVFLMDKWADLWKRIGYKVGGGSAVKGMDYDKDPIGRAGIPLKDYIKITPLKTLGGAGSPDKYDLDPDIIKANEEFQKLVDSLSRLDKALINAPGDLRRMEDTREDTDNEIKATKEKNRKKEELEQQHLDNIKQINDNFSYDMEYAFKDMFSSIILGTATVEDAFTNLLDNMAQGFFELGWDLLKEQMKGGGWASLATTLFSAKGNVFNQGQLVPFAKGAIVNSPTVFPMANGAGVMGEAGPEAILPLKRGKGGKLGVASSGGGGGINIYNTINIENGDKLTDPNEARRTFQEMGKMMRQQCKSVIADEKRVGGMLNTSINRRGM